MKPDQSILWKRPLRLAPQYRDYVWGGSRLVPGKSPVAEAWILYEEDVITAPAELAGQTLADVTRTNATALVGRRGAPAASQGFPLLIKLLDCAQWLSVQVHPDDDLAQQLEGDSARGKTEAWHFLDAAPGAEILCGLNPGVTAADFDAHLTGGSITSITRRLSIQPGDSIFIPAGTLHALGPGLLVYEVQQTSNITYRVYDWDRPATPQRPLHITQSRQAVKLESSPNLVAHPPAPADGEVAPLVTCDFFTLELLQSSTRPILLDTAGESFHALTVIRGAAQVQGDGWVETLQALETLLLPAALGAYQIHPLDTMEALLAYLPEYTVS